MGKNKQYSQNTNDGNWNGQNAFSGQPAQNAFNGQPDANAWPQQQGFDNGYGNGGFNQAAYGNAFNPQGFNGQGFNGQGFNSQGFNAQGFNAQGFNGQGFNGFPQNASTPNANVNGAFPNATQANGHSAWQSLGLSGLFGGNRQTEQFILGLLLGGAAAYVLGDPEKRAKLIRMGMKLYAGVAGSVEEFKEQIADLKAEVAAEQENAED